MSFRIVRAAVIFCSTFLGSAEELRLGEWRAYGGGDAGVGCDEPGPIGMGGAQSDQATAAICFGCRREHAERPQPGGSAAVDVHVLCHVAGLHFPSEDAHDRAGGLPQISSFGLARYFSTDCPGSAEYSAESISLHPTAPTVDPYQYPVRDALPFATDRLCDKNLPAGERALALAWVMHMTGDLHEPCHCASLISKRFPLPDGDHVATRLKIVTSPGHTTGLHQYWDSLYCAQDDLPTLKAWDASILADPALKPEALPQLKTDTTVKSWVQESYELAEHDVYDGQHSRGRRRAGC